MRLLRYCSVSLWQSCNSCAPRVPHVACVPHVAAYVTSISIGLCLVLYYVDFLNLLTPAPFLTLTLYLGILDFWITPF